MVPISTGLDKAQALTQKGQSGASPDWIYIRNYQKFSPPSRDCSFPQKGEIPQQAKQRIQECSHHSPIENIPPIPSLTQVLVAVENFLHFAPNTRQAAVNLLSSECGLHLGEFWAIAPLYAGMEVQL